MLHQNQQQFSTSAPSITKVNMAQTEKPWKCTNLGFLTFSGGHGGAKPLENCGIFQCAVTPDTKMDLLQL